MNLQIPLFRKSCIFRFVLLGVIKFSSVGRIRQFFDQILRYETYSPFAPLLFGHRSILSKQDINHRPYRKQVNKYHTFGH